MKKALKLVVIILAFLLMISMVFFVFFLPVYLEKNLLPELAKEAGIDQFACKVRKIGISRVDLSQIHMGDGSRDAVKINSLQIDYSLSELLRRHLKSVRVCGLEIFFEIIEEEVIFPGINPDKILGETDTREKNEAAGELSLPLTFDHIEIGNGMISCEWNRKILRLPLDVAILPQKDHPGIFKGVFHLYPYGSTIKTEILADLPSGNVKILLNANNFRPGDYLEYLIPAGNMQIIGAMDVTARTEININPFEIANTRMIIESPEFHMDFSEFKIGNSKETGEPLNIEIYGEDFKNWTLVVSGLFLDALPVMEIPEFRAAIHADSNAIEIHMELDTIVRCIYDCNWKISPPIESTWSGSGKYLMDDSWSMDLENTALEVLSGKKTPFWHRIKSGNIDVGFLMPQIQVSGQGILKDHKIELRVEVSEIYLDAGVVSVEMPGAGLRAETKVVDNQAAPVQAVDFILQLKAPGVRSTATDIGFKDISLKGQALIGEENTDIKAIFRLADGFATDSLYGVRAENISLEVPMVWPFSAKAEKGSFSIGTIRLKDKNLGKIRATLQQEGFGGTINGAYDSRLLSGLSLQFDGRVGQEADGLETRFEYQIDNYKIVEALNIGSLFPDGEGIFLTGLFNMEGNFNQSDSKMTGSVHMLAKDMNIYTKEPMMTVDNVSLDFRIPDIFQMRSEPHQKIRFGSATMGNIRIGSGGIDFQMQSPDQFFIEKTTFRWCGGNVDTNAAVVSLPFENIEWTFYCDRLKLAQVLEQLGGVKGEGEGAVNGRIPVMYDQGSLRFDNGFLYSTPGEGGTIRLTGTDFLMSGIPEGTPHFAQIDLAREALKHYQYDWAKLDITTEEENLNLKLKLDGKPMEVLPFEYRQDFGGFARVEAGSPGSRFQGIRLDVNFNLPLDQVLRYGKGFQDILKLGD